MSRDYKPFFAICRAIGRDKEDVILEFTNGESSSLKSLDDGEFKELMLQLRRLQPTTKAWTPPPGDEMRKKMIGIARDMHWHHGDIPIMERIDAWCLKTFAKKLNDLDVATLGKAVTIFESKVYTGYLKGLSK